MSQSKVKRHCYVRENDGSVVRRPACVARAMIARHEARDYVTGMSYAEAVQVLTEKKPINVVLAARPENQPAKSYDKDRRDK